MTFKLDFEILDFLIFANADVVSLKSNANSMLSKEPLEGLTLFLWKGYPLEARITLKNWKLSSVQVVWARLASFG